MVEQETEQLQRHFMLEIEVLFEGIRSIDCVASYVSGTPSVENTRTASARSKKFTKPSYRKSKFSLPINLPKKSMK
jgi:hypothetical protein